VFDTVVKTLEAGGHDVVATDLYAQAFDPVMSEAERQSYMSNDYEGGAVAPYIELLKKVDGFILCYPHWWFSMPAMLKGYVDRVWAPGTAFVYDRLDNHLVPNLGNIRLFGVITSYGSPWLMVRIFARDAGRHAVMSSMKPMCARDARSFYMAHYDMDHSTEKSRTAFLKKVRSRLAHIV
jgi:putative NADPH-quinone reductase